MSSSEKDTSENKDSSSKPDIEETKVQPEFKEEQILGNATYENPISNQVLSKWEQIRCNGKLPERRSYHSGIGHQHKIYIYGGYDIKEGDMKTMFCIDITDPAPEWQEIDITGDAPKGISRHSAVVWDEKIYCLGGEFNNAQL